MDWKCLEFLGKMNWKEGLLQHKELNTWVLAEEGSNKQKQMYCLKPKKKQELALLNTTEAGSEIRAKTEFVKSLNRICYAP